ncbi:MAG: cytochrome c3 family protein [Desulfovibrionaceae bacterium]
MKRYSRWMVACICAAFLIAVTHADAFAAVSGACVNCHTMHNSQDAAVMSSAAPVAHLTLNSCIGCHTSGGVGGAPVVDGRYNVDSCAGGTFKDSGTSGEIVASDAGVHNVDIALSEDIGEEGTLGSIPGLTGGMNGGKGTAVPTDLTCAGANGCHGDATVANNDGGIRGFHHGGKTGYRYLQVAANQLPILGKGASDWEAGISGGGAGPHNCYSSDPAQGISKLCANCHPNFHATTNTKDTGNNWIRHPTDNDIPGTDDGWSPTINYRDNPFAFADTDAMDPTGTYDATGAQVSCLSCHRAHGTPYADILRWDYSAQSAGSGLTYGCLGCHNKQQ